MMAFEDSTLLATDLDGTAALTFKPSPNNIDVSEAYRQAIEHEFGVMALKQYIASGEHKNRTPSEIVAEIAPDLSEQELLDKSACLVATKIAIIEPEIVAGPKMWPEPSEGFLESWERINANTAVVSSGHRVLIRKMFDTWGVRQPDILISEETLRETEPEKPIAQKVKPHAFSLELALAQWTELYDVPKDTRNYRLALMKAHNKVVYVGDDIDKDGGMAASCNIPFVLIEQLNSRQGWQAAISKLGHVSVRL
jgi:hypothetical protein